MEKKMERLLIIIIVLLSVLLLLLLTIFLVFNNYKDKETNYSTEEVSTSIIIKSSSINYFCDDGFDLEGTNCVSYQYEQPKIDSACDSGYSLGFGDYPNLCHKRETKKVDVCQWYCDPGYTLYNYQCYMVMEEFGVLEENYCQSGLLYGSNMCKLKTTNSSCPYRYRMFSTNNPKYHPAETICLGDIRTYHYCPSGSHMLNGLCVFDIPRDAKVVRGCHGKYQLNEAEGYCYYDDYQVPQNNISCPSGFTLNSSYACERKIIQPAKEKNVCEDDFSLGDNNECYKTIY